MRHSPASMPATVSIPMRLAADLPAPLSTEPDVAALSPVTWAGAATP